MKHLSAIVFLVCYLLLLPSLPSRYSQVTDPKATEVWQPEPRVVTPGEGTQPPSDAIVLFDGANFGEWWSAKDSVAVQWTLNGDGSATVKPGAGDIMTKRVFGDCQLHLEFRAPSVVKGEGQERGNSGVFIESVHESVAHLKFSAENQPLP